MLTSQLDKVLDAVWEEAQGRVGTAARPKPDSQGHARVQPPVGLGRLLHGNALYGATGDARGGLDEKPAITPKIIAETTTQRRRSTSLWKPE